MIDALAEQLLLDLTEHQRALVVLDLQREGWREGITPTDVTRAVHQLPKRLGPLPPDQRGEVEEAYAEAYGGEITIRDRPVRAPHHTISIFGLTGSPQRPSPGEAALAHGGFLYLEDLGEFHARAIKALARVLDEGEDYGGFPAEPFGVIGTHIRDWRTPPAAQKREDERVRKFAEALDMVRVF